MKNSDENIAAFQIVLPLHNSLLHIITRASGYTVEGEKKWGGLMKGTKNLHINKFSDLKGARVALVGSAQWLEPLLEQKFQYGMRFINADSDEQAQKMLQRLKSALSKNCLISRKVPIGQDGKKLLLLQKPTGSGRDTFCQG